MSTGQLTVSFELAPESPESMDQRNDVINLAVDDGDLVAHSGKYYLPDAAPLDEGESVANDESASPPDSVAADEHEVHGQRLQDHADSFAVFAESSPDELTGPEKRARLRRYMVE